MKKQFLSVLAVVAITFITCGYSQVDDVQSQVQEIANSETQTAQEQLTETLEAVVDVETRVKDEMEREMVLNILNLNSKKHMSRKEKRRFRSVYKEMPKTIDEYNAMSMDIKRHDRDNAKPIRPIDAKIVKIDEPRIVVKKYNSPPGTQNIDLRNLRTQRTVNSLGVISPNKDMIAYTSVYYEGFSDKVSSEIFTVPMNTSLPLKKSAQMASLVNKVPVKLLGTGVDDEYKSLFRTLTIVDWSKDGKKLAIKERVGSSNFGLWQTNLWVYDFDTKKSRQLVEVRDAIKYWWKESKSVNVDNYMWDIVPLGWDELNEDRIIVATYAYTKEKSTKYLGLFSVSADGRNSQLISTKPMSVGISANGLILKNVPTAF